MKSRQLTRRFRHKRVRKKVAGTPERPRMALMVSNKAMYVQFMDDVNAVTLASASSLKSDIAKNVEGAKALGRIAAGAAKEKGIRDVVVDRGGFLFHGRVKAVVAAAVEAGLSVTSKEEK